MKILGIDFGEKRIGLALSDDKMMMAFPYSVIENNKKAIEEIKKIASENSVSDIIIGKSVDYKGKDNPIMKNIYSFKESLEVLGFMVHFESEILSSHQATHFQGKTKMIDASAATIILQSYIDRIKNK